MHLVGVNYFIVGTAARDIIFGEYEINTGRATRDLDIGFQVKSWNHFLKSKIGLLKTKILPKDYPRNSKSDSNFNKKQKKRLTSKKRIPIILHQRMEYAATKMKIGNEQVCH